MREAAKNGKTEQSEFCDLRTVRYKIRIYGIKILFG